MLQHYFKINDKNVTKYFSFIIEYVCNEKTS